MSDKHIDAQLQAIEQELLTASLPETLEINSPEPVQIPRRKRSLLTRVRRQYDRLDDKFQQPLVVLGSVVGSKYTRAFLTASVGCLLVWYTASSGNPNPTLGSFPKPNALPGVKVVTTETAVVGTDHTLPEGVGVRAIYTEITAVSESSGWESCDECSAGATYH